MVNDPRIDGTLAACEITDVHNYSRFAPLATAVGRITQDTKHGTPYPILTE